MTWQAECEVILMDVAADDLSGRPIYILNGRDVERYDQRLASDGMGWTSRVADLMLADHLADQWQGRGFACVVYPERCQDAQHLVGCVLHEAAHHLTYPVPSATTVPVEAVSVELLSWIPQRPRPATPISTPPWYQHEAPFTRAAAMLAYRVSNIIESVRPHHLRFVRPYYQGFTEDHFVQALHDDVRRSGSIRDILADDPPGAFTRLYAMATL